jgi:hypothetical protein
MSGFYAGKIAFYVSLKREICSRAGGRYVADRTPVMQQLVLICSLHWVQYKQQNNGRSCLRNQ